MMAPHVDVFSAAQDSIDWANEAISEFEAVTAQFLRDPKNANFVHEHHPNTRKHVLKFKVFKPFPASFRRKATDALVTARHSFDQSTYAAVSFFRSVGNNSINFPWAKNPTDLQKLLEKRNIPQELWATFKGKEPYGRSDSYPGGNDLIRTLATIANDKHTVGLVVQGDASSINPGSPTIIGCNEFKVLVPRWDSMRDEIVLLTVIADHFEAPDDANVTLHILLENAKLSHPVDAAFAFKEFATFAQEVLNDLKTVCTSQPGGG